jgi:hypothetical protein
VDEPRRMKLRGVRVKSISSVPTLTLSKAETIIMVARSLSTMINSLEGGGFGVGVGGGGCEGEGG